MGCAKLYGLAFGLESAVVSFNRWPQLAIAISRRCVCSLSAAYFDDEMCLEPLLFADPSQQGLRLVLRLLGSEPQKAKGFRPAADRHYLGASVHLGNFASQGVIRFQPKFTTTQKVLAKLHHALQTNQLDRDSAGKLRGDLQWMYSQCAGHLGRLAGQVFEPPSCPMNKDSHYRIALVVGTYRQSSVGVWQIVRSQTERVQPINLWTLHRRL